MSITSWKLKQVPLWSNFPCPYWHLRDVECWCHQWAHKSLLRCVSYWVIMEEVTFISYFTSLSLVSLWYWRHKFVHKICIEILMVRSDISTHTFWRKLQQFGLFNLVCASNEFVKIQICLFKVAQITIYPKKKKVEQIK